MPTWSNLLDLKRLIALRSDIRHTGSLVFREDPLAATR